RNRDGQERWIETTLTNLLHEPSVRGVVSQFRDVTDRVTALAQLDEAHRRFAYLLSATSAVTYSASPEPPFGATFLSENVAAVLGYSAAQFLAEPGFWVDRIHPADRERDQPRELIGFFFDVSARREA